MSDIHQRAQDVRTAALVGKIGDPLSKAGRFYSFSGFNAGGQAAQVSTIVVDTAANSTAYTVSVEGQTISITSDASATKPEIAAALAAAINANTIARAKCSAVSDGVDTVTLTGVWPGISFSASDSDANLTTSTTTAAASASSITFGRGLIFEDVTGQSILGPKLALANTAGLNAQVVTFDLTGSAPANGGLSLEIDMPGYPKVVAAVAWDTDLDTTAAALVTEANARIDALIGSSGAATVAYTSGTDVLTVTAQQAGKTFKAALFGTDDAMAFTYSDTADTDPWTDATKVFAGIALNAVDEPAALLDATATAYLPNSMVNCCDKGMVWVASSTDPSFLAPVWLELGTDAGGFYASASATRVLIPGARWVHNQPSGGSDGIAVIELR